MYKIKQDPHVLPPGFGYGWPNAVAMKMAYIIPPGGFNSLPNNLPFCPL